MCVRFCAADALPNPLPNPIPWNPNAQGRFITSLCRDLRGNVWIGTEDQGVWRFDPTAPIGKQYSHFTTQDGLGDNNAYALVCDKAGRLWAGTLNHGVSVFNGKTWRTYGPLDGPLGSRVFALAVNPQDGGVWGATEAGLFRYQGGAWTYFTRADGLPSDQANALAFGPDGTLYVGTQCDGLAMASPADHYQTWRVVPGPTQLPLTATGLGLPCPLMNCLLVASDGTVYAGTPQGLAESRNAGLTWSFRRGEEWKAKLAGLYPPVKPVERPVQGDLLREDWVTCLAEGEPGQLVIGHRRLGLEIVRLRDWKRVFPGPHDKPLTDYVTALLTQPDGASLVGGYGGGLMETLSPAGAVKVLPPPTAPVASAEIASPLPAFPTAAKPPTLAELNAMLLRVQSFTAEMPVGGGAYLGEDWQTQGDWVGRYGSRYAVLCACGAPLNNYVLSDFSYEVSGFIGPHHKKRDGLRTWCLWVKTADPRVLWDPIPGYRREAEWDDHGEAYLQTYAGPDVWAKVKVPIGLHQLSLYFVNANGHTSSVRSRDYLLEIKAVPTGEPPTNIPLDPDHYPTIAQARAQGFWFGVYKRFAVRGPGLFLVKVGRNNSYNTILPALMLDKLTGPLTEWETRRSVWYGKDTYKPLEVIKIKMASATVVAAQNLWDSLEQSRDKVGAIPLLPAYHLMAYRALIGEANKTGNNEEKMNRLLANWRWHLSLWDSSQRKEFQQQMQATWHGLVVNNPKLALGNQ